LGQTAYYKSLNSDFLWLGHACDWGWNMIWRQPHSYQREIFSGAQHAPCFYLNAPDRSVCFWSVRGPIELRQKITVPVGGQQLGSEF